MCQDPVGWKVKHSQPSTPPKQQRPTDLSMQQNGDAQHADDGVDSPTATANGPAVQPVSAEKAKKPSKQPAKQASATAAAGAANGGGEQSGAAAQEDPEKKAKKVHAALEAWACLYAGIAVAGAVLRLFFCRNWECFQLTLHECAVVVHATIINASSYVQCCPCSGQYCTRAQASAADIAERHAKDAVRNMSSSA